MTEEQQRQQESPTGAPPEGAEHVRPAAPAAEEQARQATEGSAPDRPTASFAVPAPGRSTSLVRELGWLGVAIPVAILVGVGLVFLFPSNAGYWSLATILGIVAGGIVLLAWRRLVIGPATLEVAPVASAEVAPPEGVGLAQTPAAKGVTRRHFILGGFFSGLGLLTAASLGAMWNLMYPRKLAGFGGTFVINADQVPKPGDPPLRVIEGKFYLVNLKEGEGVYGDFGQPGPGGLLALYQKCTHLGCTVPWRGEFDYGGSKGWFRCPCHGSTFTKAGIRVAGPAPRPMDTMAVTVDEQGRVVVDTGRIRLGGADNPLRVIAYQAQQAASFFRRRRQRG